MKTNKKHSNEAHSEPLQQCSVVGSASKPTHVKPSFYAFIYEQIKDIAKDYGYNLVLHGSMNRDLDLIAIPWTDSPKTELELVHKIDETIDEASRNAEHKYQFSVLPGGRNNYVINICRGGEWNKYQDANFYLDISFTPQVSEGENL